MAKYQAVSSSHNISKKIADLLEDIDPIQYNGNNRARRVRNVNDYLQGRNDMPLEALLDWAAKANDGAHADRVAAIRDMIQALQAQKSLIDQPYPLPYTLERPYLRYTDDPLNPVKIIGQTLFDRAANSGFPHGFFRHSCFDSVNIYCLPDGEDCSHSTFRNCNFTACRINGTLFPSVTMQDCEFNSCELQETIFYEASIVGTHFRDCTLRSVSFQEARLKSCLTVDCILDRIDFFQSVLDGCTYGRIRATGIINLPYARITQGGATAEECARNRAALFKALGVEDPDRPPERRHSSRLER